MDKILTKLQYKFFSKSIQKALEKAEYAGNEAAKFACESRIRELELETHPASIQVRVNKALADLNYSVNPTDVLSATQDKAGHVVEIKLGDRVLNKTEVRNLQNQARFFKDSMLYDIMMNTPKDKAQQIMFTKSQTYDDMKSGKMLIFAIDLQEKILQSIEGFDTKK